VRIILEVGGGYPSSIVLFHLSLSLSLSLSLKDFANWPASWSPSPGFFPFQLEEIDERGLEEAGRRGIYRPVSSVERDREQKRNKGTLAGTQH